MGNGSKCSNLRSGFAVDVRNISGIYMNTSSKTIKPARVFSSGSPFTNRLIFYTRFDGKYLFCSVCFRFLNFHPVVLLC